MEVVIVDSAREAGRIAADAIAELYAANPRAVLGVATGSSPLTIYRELAERVTTGDLSLAEARAFMLDEYVGLAEEHPQRYRNVIDRDFVSKLDIDPANVSGPDGQADDLVAECAAYEQAISAAGGIDLQILGVGADGHIAFNEPGSSLGSRTRIKTLTRQTRTDNARFFDDIEAVPHHCLTQGLGTIMQCRHALLVATGRHKAEAVHHVVEGPITAMWPGSVLQLHPHVTVILDRPAASRLQLATYYEEAYRAKPPWQQL
ncbi:MAG: glucosamine-6-phosphate deaminase [Intrasporangium sp.]|uniref:glucosamine-6-phosphate deaminase n=1 Tax=Intrasporangium sp. TaxID=1925024 RepID=UPI0026490901|nr:glucosamine-6-phosphate deaminase [Intrasporangium sp.]MDN5796010.1 glucosamine-6-phosphate deaminase [Intrasporangium sp.]